MIKLDNPLKQEIKTLKSFSLSKFVNLKLALKKITHKKIVQKIFRKYLPLHANI